MSTINLIIGGADVSEYAERENYSVKKVWKQASVFTNQSGAKSIKNYGSYYELYAQLNGIPDALMRSLTAALDAASVEIEFTDPHSAAGVTTANFLRGESVGGEVAYETDDGLHWNLTVKLESELAASADGL